MLNIASPTAVPTIQKISSSSPLSSPSPSHSANLTIQVVCPQTGDLQSKYICNRFDMTSQSDLISRLLQPYKGIPDDHHLTITIKPPYPDCLCGILNWMTNHDDEKWIASMNDGNFHHIIANLGYLELGQEAYYVCTEYYVDSETWDD